MAEDGTVLNELQMLEKQLDRLAPSLEKFNTRISSMEADIGNLKDKIKELREHDTELYSFKSTAEQKFVGIERDIARLEQDIEGLRAEIVNLEGDARDSRKTWSNRLWRLFEIILAAILGLYITYDQLLKPKPQTNINEEKQNGRP